MYICCFWYAGQGPWKSFSDHDFDHPLYGRFFTVEGAVEAIQTHLNASPPVSNWHPIAVFDENLTVPEVIVQTNGELADRYPGVPRIRPDEECFPLVVV